MPSTSFPFPAAPGLLPLRLPRRPDREPGAAASDPAARRGRSAARAETDGFQARDNAVRAAETGFGGIHGKDLRFLCKNDRDAVRRNVVRSTEDRHGIRSNHDIRRDQHSCQFEGAA